MIVVVWLWVLDLRGRYSMPLLGLNVWLSRVWRNSRFSGLFGGDGDCFWGYW